MVKRILHLVLAISVLLSLSACAAGNNGGNNNADRNNTGTDTRRLTQPDTNTITYRDGVYTGYGDAHANGNEAATVVIRNGKIANIDLINVGQQGGANNAAGTTNPGTTGRSGIANAPTPGRVTGSPTDTGIGNGTGTGTGTTGGTVTDAINDIRTRLVNAIIREQRYDVNIYNTDTALASTINNWKLAVRRALDQAR